MTIICYILIGLGLLCTFILWRIWKNTEFLVKIVGEDENDIDSAMWGLYKFIWFCYLLAFGLRYFFS